MKARQNFALGALIAVSVMIPTLTESARVNPKENAIATFAAARNRAEVKLACSVHRFGNGIAAWIRDRTASL
ncbi:MAG TPA: hypothetical protein VG819_09105 [Rhizomicrobium sp.]|jgi:hypothetical protein|nr:hypothetical protein [Rhizomicrobium sp.]